MTNVIEVRVGRVSLWQFVFGVQDPKDDDKGNIGRECLKLSLESLKEPNWLCDSNNGKEVRGQWNLAVDRLYRTLLSIIMHMGFMKYTDKQRSGMIGTEITTLLYRWIRKHKETRMELTRCECQVWTDCSHKDRNSRFGDEWRHYQHIQTGLEHYILGSAGGLDDELCLACGPCYFGDDTVD